MKTIRSTNARGFTVIELMIATAIFGVVLLVIATAILQITRVYYRGVTETNTQNTARNIIDTISQAIQFNGGAITETPTGTPVAGTSYAFCAGNQQYSFQVGHQLTDSGSPSPTQKRHALVVRDLASCPGLPAQSMSGSVAGRELLSPNMRLTKLEVTNVGTNLYKISVRVVHGDDDILTNPTAANAACQAAWQGTQFCAISDISTVVTKRVE